MKEFTDKLISRLEKLGWVYADYYPDETAIHRQRKKSVAYDNVISIINELAEEYKDCILVHTQGLDVGIQCAMCINSMKSDTGCDGGCSVNEEMYKKVLAVIDRHTQNAPCTEGERT